MAPAAPRQPGYYADASRIFCFRYKIASRVLVVFESILGKLMLVVAICTIIYNDSWFPVVVNVAFVIFLIASVVCYNQCHRRRNAVFVLPMLSYEVVTIFWLILWACAALNAVVTGDLWSLEWLGGPGSSEFHKDLMVPKNGGQTDQQKHFDPYEDHSKKAFKLGLIIFAVCTLIIVCKLFAFVIAKRTYVEIRIHQIRELDKADQPRTSSDREMANLASGTSKTTYKPSWGPRQVDSARRELENNPRTSSKSRIPNEYQLQRPLLASPRTSVAANVSCDSHRESTF